MREGETMTKKILYIDMDNTLVDFSAKLQGVDQSVLDKYRGRFDETPGLFSLMPPKQGALEAFKELSKLYDTYILSTSPWRNPSAGQHKAEWVHLHLGIDEDTPAYKRLILSHHKDLNDGHFLIDDRPWHNGVDKFRGSVIHFGVESDHDAWPANVVAHLSTWPQVVDYLKDRLNDRAVVLPASPFAALDRDERLDQVSRAEAIATIAHRGQSDKLGVDYIKHPAAVAARFNPLEQTLECCAAWLHDVIEDTGIDGPLLERAGIHPEVVAVVELLTRRDGIGDSYYEQIADNPAARAVKLSDIRHNIEPDRTARLPGDVRKRLAEKYRHALDLLDADFTELEPLERHDI